jgi:hypothetical protein
VIIVVEGTDLHVHLDVLCSEPGDLTRVIGHMLIELGNITRLECAYEDCVLESREFAAGSKRQAAGITIDHVIPLCDGGSDMPDNIRLIHFACNNSKGGKELWADPIRKASMLAARVDTPEAKAKRSESLRRTEAARSDEDRAQVVAARTGWWAEKTQDERTAIARKGWETRRATG